MPLHFQVEDDDVAEVEREVDGNSKEEEVVDDQIEEVEKQEEMDEEEQSKEV